MRNALIRAPDIARFAIELYKHPFLTYLDLSLDIPPHARHGDRTGDLRVDDRGALGYRRNYIGIGLEGIESLSVWLTTTRVLKKLRCGPGQFGSSALACVGVERGVSPPPLPAAYAVH